MLRRGGEELLDAKSFQTQSDFSRRVATVVREELAAQAMSLGTFAQKLEVPEEKASELLDANDVSFPMMAKLLLAVGLEPGPALSERLNALDVGD